ncbi:pentapeptide repeat-containing protein [Glutamicibacter protophormiae]|nr:pentapeptide repeat-containing protein [Glutamicibacter protophormiae]QRQ79335.1 pentapeptide repeat-containing protein [Glutamicibacter protophormiae]
MGKDSEGRVPDAKPDHENPAFWRRWVRSLKKWGPLLWFHKRLKKLHEQLEQSPLLVASLWAITGALVAFGVLWILIGFVMHGFWTWGLGPGDTTRADAVRTVLTMIAGVGGIIYLTIAYRRQRGVEASDFMNRLENAARQLGSSDPMVQYAGIYALEALADENATERKQLCVDVLCAYLRLPYQGNGRPTLLKEVVEKHAWTDGRRNVEEIRTHQLRPADKEVRLTIIRTISRHLQDDASKTWSGLDLDFTGAVIDGGDFSGAVFSGGKVSFSGAKFSGGKVSFSGAKFSGGQVNFDGAEFLGGKVTFFGAQFSDGEVTFFGVRFSGGEVSFSEVQFCGGEVSFGRAKFFGGKVSFGYAEFSGGKVTLNGAEFFGGKVSFGRARFSEEAEVSFGRAKFSGGEVPFSGAKFIGGEVSFFGAKFSDGDVDLSDAKFSGGHVDFRKPAAWDAPPRVPWDDGQPPVNVLPDQWPPTVWIPKE